MKQPCSQKPPAEKKRPPTFNISWGENAQNTHYSELFKILDAQKRARVVSARTRTRSRIRHLLRLIPNLVEAAAAGWDVT